MSDTPMSPNKTPIGCVSFLNSKPLVDPLLNEPHIQVHFAVPSALLPMIESRAVSVALLSVVDYHLSAPDLLLIPAGMIGCDGPTLTVRIFSRVPAERIRTLHADTDSHTSVILAQLILRERYGVAPPIQPLHAREGVHPADAPETMLLIGDKVVNASPSAADYPYQLDLGEQWKSLTGLPFVFAMWMMDRRALEAGRQDAAGSCGNWRQARMKGAQMTEALLDKYAAEKQWPRDLARRYFVEFLRYEVTPAAREGLALFFELSAKLQLLKLRRPVNYLEIEPAADACMKTVSVQLTGPGMGAIGVILLAGERALEIAKAAFARPREKSVPGRNRARRRLRSGGRAWQSSAG